MESKNPTGNKVSGQRNGQSEGQKNRKPRRPRPKRRRGRVSASEENNATGSNPNNNRNNSGNRNDRSEGQDQVPISRNKKRRSRRKKLYKRNISQSSKQPEYDEKKIKEGPQGSEQGEKKKRKRTKGIRLNRYLANSGICSRREADELITKGQVTVNGQKVTELGMRVSKRDNVKFKGRSVKPEKSVYLLLNKPKDYITTVKDPKGRKTVMELVEGACPQRVYPVGRLDRNTTGLLLFTNDGELAKKLTHPSHQIQKIYKVEVDKPVQEEHLDKIRNGFDLEDGHVRIDNIAKLSMDGKSLGIEIHMGRNRIVRRIFEYFGYDVVKLDRTLFAGLTKDSVPSGQWRFLSEKEVIRLKFFTGKKLLT